MLFWYAMSVLIGKKHVIYGETVKLNAQRVKRLSACWQWATIGDSLIRIPLQMLSSQYITRISD